MWIARPASTSQSVEQQHVTLMSIEVHGSLPRAINSSQHHNVVVVVG
jgi:hypothetical protein